MQVQFNIGVHNHYTKVTDGPINSEDMDKAIGNTEECKKLIQWLLDFKNDRLPSLYDTAFVALEYAAANREFLNKIPQDQCLYLQRLIRLAFEKAMETNKTLAKPDAKNVSQAVVAIIRRKNHTQNEWCCVIL